MENYSTVKKIMDMFVESEKIIPFADLHHYRQTNKKIKQKRFAIFVEKIYNNLSLKADNVREKVRKDEVKEVINNINELNVQQKINWLALYRGSIERRNSQTNF